MGSKITKERLVLKLLQAQILPRKGLVDNVENGAELGLIDPNRFFEIGQSASWVPVEYEQRAAVKADSLPLFVISIFASAPSSIEVSGISRPAILRLARIAPILHAAVMTSSAVLMKEETSCLNVLQAPSIG